MKKPTQMKSKVLIFFLLQTILNVVNITVAEPLYSDIFRCKKDSGTFQPNSPYKTNLMAALKKLNASGYALVNGKPDERVYAVTLCAGYLKPNDCTSCITKTIPLLLEKCSNQKAAAAWRVSCMVRYGAPVVNNYDDWFLAHEVSAIKAMDAALLEKSLSKMLSTLPGEVTKDLEERYAYMDLNYGRQGKVYMVMQCTTDISHNDCNKCLLKVASEVKPCCSGVTAAAVLSPNCYVRFSHGDFRGGTRSITII